MLTRLPAALSGLFVFAACTAFTLLREVQPLHVALIALMPAIVLTLATGFISIGGFQALHTGRAADVRLCAGLTLFWTFVQVALALVLLRAVLPEGATTLDPAHWLIATTLAQMALLALMMRAQTTQAKRDIQLK